ncbi:hypothetical protein COB52_04365 [Candidatus Kaiserbacteria bacterium]|nr:MAG: hypothetical protein COB52_04365 [Candidatus Kaiserbacteria bacterium]
MFQLKIKLSNKTVFWRQVRTYFIFYFDLMADVVHEQLVLVGDISTAKDTQEFTNSLIATKILAFEIEIYFLKHNISVPETLAINKSNLNPITVASILLAFKINEDFSLIWEDVSIRRFSTKIGILKYHDLIRHWESHLFHILTTLLPGGILNLYWFREIPEDELLGLFEKTLSDKYLAETIHRKIHYQTCDMCRTNFLHTL